MKYRWTGKLIGKMESFPANSFRHNHVAILMMMMAILMIPSPTAYF